MKNKKVEFFMPMKKVPTITHQEKQARVVYDKEKKKHIPVFFEPAELKEVRAKFMAQLGQHLPKQKFVGPVRLTTWWCFGTKDKKKGGKYKYTRPDCTNLIKLFEDCMTDLGYWNDDGQVASLVVNKYWTNEVPGIYVKVEILEK